MSTAVDAALDDRQPKAKVFISYSRKDMAFADQLEAALKARGIEPLIDRSEIYAFEDWWKRIEALIVQADTIVMVLSPTRFLPRCARRRSRSRLRSTSVSRRSCGGAWTTGRCPNRSHASTSSSSTTMRGSTRARTVSPKRLQPTSTGSGSTRRSAKSRAAGRPTDDRE